MNVIKKRLEATLSKDQTKDFYELWFSKIAEQTDYTNKAYNELVQAYTNNKDMGDIGRGLTLDDVKKCMRSGMYTQFLGPESNGSHKNLSAITEVIDANKKFGNELTNLYQIYSSFAKNYEQLPDEVYVGANKKR